jgi:hypothetical protein
MTTVQKWFVAAAVFGAVFLFQANKIERLKEDATVLGAQIDVVNNPWSTQNVNMYCRAFFDGVTWGVFAEEGVFTEANRQDRLYDNLRDRSASLYSRYKTACLYRNASCLGAILALVVAFVVRRKKAKQHFLSSPAPSCTDCAS